jgi:hypothetical protein
MSAKEKRVENPHPHQAVRKNLNILPNSVGICNWDFLSSLNAEGFRQDWV